MKNWKIKRIVTAAAAVVLVLSLSAAAFAEGSDQETTSGQLPDQQAQQFAPQPGQVPGAQADQGGSGMPGQNNGSFPSGKGRQDSRQGMDQQKKGGKPGTDKCFDDISAAINGLEDGETKNQLNSLFEAWKAALETSRTANGTADKSALTEAETALNEALKAAGLTVQAGRSGGQLRQDGFQRHSPAGRGIASDPFSEIRSAIDQLEDEETKSRLTALLDELMSALGKEPVADAGGSSDGIASAEAALNDALAQAGIDVKAGNPDTIPEAVGAVPPEPAAGAEPSAPASSEGSGGKDMSELLDMIRDWLKSVSD